MLCVLFSLASCATKKVSPNESKSSTALDDDEFTDVDITSNAQDPDISGAESNSAGATGNSTGTTSKKPSIDIKTDPSVQPKAITLTNKKVKIIGIDQEQFRQSGSAAKYFKEKYGGEIEQIVTSSAEWFTKLQSMQMAGSPPDLVAATSGGFPNQIPQNTLQTVDGIIDINHPVMKDLKSGYDKYAYKGQHYLVPWLYTATDFVFYNKKMLKDAALEDPFTLQKQGKWDWDMYKQYAKSLQQKSGNTVKVWGLSFINHHQGYLIDSTGKSTVTLDGSGLFKSNLRDSDIKRAVNFLDDLVNISKLATVTDATSDLDEGRAAMQQAPYFFNDSYPKLKNAKNLGFAPMPKDPQNKNYYQSGAVLGYFVSKGKNINKQGIEAFIQSAVISEKLKKVPASDQYKENLAAMKAKWKTYTEAELVAENDRFEEIFSLPTFFSPVDYVAPQKLYWECVGGLGISKRPYDTVIEELEPELNGKIKDLNDALK